MQDVVRVSGGHAVTEGMKRAREDEFNRCDTYHVFGYGRGGCAENAGDFADAFVLGDLQHIDEVFLAMTRVPDLRSVC